MKKTIKTCSMALALCAFAGTASAQVFFQGDWSAGNLPGMPGISQNGDQYIDGEYPLNAPGAFGTVAGGLEPDGNPGSYLRFNTWNNIWAVAIENTSPEYEFNFDYIIHQASNYTGWEVIGVEAGQAVTNIHKQQRYGEGSTLAGGPSGGTLLARGDLSGEGQGWLSHQSGIIEAGEEFSSIIFRLHRNGNGTALPTGQAGFDNITITAIPEPSTYAAFFGVFVLGIALWRRRATAQR